MKMRRFSWAVFVVAVLVHLYVTDRLIGASFSAERAVMNGQPEQSFLWLKVWSWIWQPVPMLLHLFGVHFGVTTYGVIALTWSICIGLGLGYFGPRLFRHGSRPT